MENKKLLFIANLCRYAARIGLLFIGVVVFLFALVSGSNPDEGVMGIILNSPNAIPWVFLLGLVFIAWKYEFVGGIILTIFSLAVLILFNFVGPNFFIATFFMSLCLVLLSSLFIVSWYIRRKLK